MTKSTTGSQGSGRADVFCVLQYAVDSRTVEGGVLLLDGLPVDARVRHATPDAEEGVNVDAGVEVAASQEALPALTLAHLRLVRVQQQVLVPVRH